jgi:hypothetical protein
MEMWQQLPLISLDNKDCFQNSLSQFLKIVKACYQLIQANLTVLVTKEKNKGKVDVHKTYQDY